MQDKRRIFIEPVLKGERFNDPSIPHEILPDLEGYLKIVIAFAKELYRKEHPKKTRLQKGFEARFKVRLTGIELGSTKPVFSREYDEDSWENDEFDRARDIINQQLLSLERNVQFSGFSEKIIPLFKSFGENLKPDETIELKIPGRKEIPIYSKEIRSRILSINQKPYQDICYLSGAISGFRAKDGLFYLVLNDSEQILGPLEGSFDTPLREIATKYGLEEIGITLVGIAKYNPDHSISQIERLQHVTVFKEGIAIFLPDPFKRIDEFAEMEDGWFDGKGRKFEQNELMKAKEWLVGLLQTAEIPAPFVYPSPDHLLTAEWSLGFWEIICSFEFDPQNIILHATHTLSEETREDKIVFDINSISRAIRFLKNLLSSQQE